MFLRGGVILPRRMNAGRRMSALTRSGVVLLHGIVNRGPSRRCVPPVIAPAEGIVRAGAVLRGDAVLSECFMFGSRRSLRFSRGVLCSITPAVCRVSAKQDGLRYVAFLFRRGS